MAPAGLLVSVLLHRHAIASVVVEKHRRGHVSVTRPCRRARADYDGYLQHLESSHHARVALVEQCSGSPFEG